MLQFYKPNPKSTGSACSFSYNKTDKALWVNFIKQASWSTQSKTGTFKGSGPDKKANSKFSVTELAGLVHAIETNGEYGGFHGTKERNTTFKFSPYIRDGSQIGYSFSLNQNNTQEGTKKSFIIGFNFAEGRMLKQYALTVLNNYFTDCIEESQFSTSHPAANKKTEEKIETSAPSKDNSQEVDLDVPW
jgi:hypothetical protein